MIDLKSDIILLFTARIVRLFAYGLLSVILFLYLVQIGLSEQIIGLLLTLTLIGDAGISLWITTSADRLGRRSMLLLGAGLMNLAALTFIFTNNPVLLIIAAIVGVISPSGNEIGPFLSIEQAALSQLLPSDRRTYVFAWYNLLGSFATALGTLGGGLLAHVLQEHGMTPVDSYRVVIMCYAAGGFLLALFFMGLSTAVEVDEKILPSPTTKRIMGLHRSRGIVMKLSGLFALDAFAGGFIVQSITTYWFYIRFHVDIGTLGGIFFVANTLAGISALLSASLAARIGLINTMVFTHLPSNILLCLIPLMPTLPLAVLLLLIRYSISQMDVPVRQSYTMAVVDPDERSAASGVTTIARSVGAAFSPVLSGLFLANPLLINVPFFLAGGLKIVYDLTLYHSFKALKPLEEKSSIATVRESQR